MNSVPLEKTDQCLGSALFVRILNNICSLEAAKLST